MDGLEKVFQTEIKAASYDEAEQFDDSLLKLLQDHGAYGLQAPEELNGSGLCNTEYARLVNIIGMHDLAVGVHLGAHQVCVITTHSNVPIPPPRMIVSAEYWL